MNIDCKIETSIIDSKVYQSIHTMIDGIRHDLVTYITDTREKEIKDALIKLGWTPPKGE